MPRVHHFLPSYAESNQDPWFSVTNFSSNKLINGSEILPRAARSLALAREKRNPGRKTSHALTGKTCTKSRFQARFSVFGNRRGNLRQVVLC